MLFIFDKAKCLYFTKTYLLQTEAFPVSIHPKSDSGVKKRLSEWFHTLWFFARLGYSWSFPQELVSVNFRQPARPSGDVCTPKSALHKQEQKLQKLQFIYNNLFTLRYSCNCIAKWINCYKWLAIFVNVFGYSNLKIIMKKIKLL